MQNCRLPHRQATLSQNPLLGAVLFLFIYKLPNFVVITFFCNSCQFFECFIIILVPFLKFTTIQKLPNSCKPFFFFNFLNYQSIYNIVSRVRKVSCLEGYWNFFYFNPISILITCNLCSKFFENVFPRNTPTTTINVSTTFVYRLVYLTSWNN